MSINLLDMVKDVAGDTLMNQAGKFLGVNESSTKSAFGAILPSLMGSLINKGADDNGASSVLNFLNTNNHDGSILDKVGDLFGGGAATDGLMNSGAGILKFLLGNKLGSLTDLISDKSGLNIGASSSLLKMLSPLLMGVVGKYVKNKALDALGLKNLFMGQRDHLKSAMPSGLSKLMGFSAFSDMGDKVAETASNIGSSASAAADRTVDTAKAGTSKLLPWLLGLAALLAALFLFKKGCSDTTVGDAMDNVTDKVENTMSDAADGVSNAAGAVADGVSDAAGKVGDMISSISLPSGTEIKAKAGSFMDNLAKYIAGSDVDVKRAFTFDNLNFETGSDVISADSKAQLDDLATVLNAYKNVNIRVAGHTDNTGDAGNNKTLSENRAKSVKAYLVGKGIPGARVEAVGHGQENAVASNATEEGRAKNRRVEVYVTKK